MAILANDLNEALLAEFAVIAFGFGDAVGISDEDVAGSKLDGRFAIVHVIEQADDRAAAIEQTRGAIFGEKDGRQMAAVGVSEAAVDGVVDAEKERRVFCVGCAFVKLMIEQAEEDGRGNFGTRRVANGDAMAGVSAERRWVATLARVYSVGGH